jgi:phage portal protein BeeE
MGFFASYGRLYDAALGAAAGFALKAAGRGGPSRGERAATRMAGLGGGAGLAYPGSAQVDKLNQVQQFFGWTSACVRYKARLVGRVPRAVRLATAAERAKDHRDYRLRVKAFAEGRLATPPAARRWVGKAARLTRGGVKGVVGPDRADAAEELEHLGDDHPLSRLLADPNGPDVGVVFWPYFASFYHLCGESFLWKVRDDAHRVVELWVLPSHWVTPRSDGDRFFAYYEVRAWGASGGVEKLDANDVVHWRWPGLAHPASPFSEAQAAAAPIDTHQMIQAVRYSLLQNGAQIGGVLKLPTGANDLSQDSLNRLLARFQSQFAGVYNAGRPLIVPGDGDYTHPPAEFELALGQSEDQARKNVMAAFGLDESLMGFSNESTYAGSVVTWKRLRHAIIQPDHEVLAAVLSERLAPEFGDDLACVFPDEGGLEDPAERRADWQAAMAHPLGPAVTWNETRVTLLGLEPVDDDAADKLWGQPALVPAEHLGEGGDLGGLVGEGGGTPGVPPGPAEPPPDDGGQTPRPGGEFGATLEGAKAHGPPPSPLDVLGAAVLEALGVPAAKDHGPPPSPGLVLDPARHRWVRPDGGDAGEGGGADASAHPAVGGALAKLTAGAAALATKFRAACAGLDPADVLGTIDDWARLWVTHHADPVAHHLGVDAVTAGLVLAHVLGHAADGVRRHLAPAAGAKAADPPDYAVALADGDAIDELTFAAKDAAAAHGPPGPPPRPGLEWNRQTHRWVRPGEAGGKDRAAWAREATRGLAAQAAAKLGVSEAEAHETLAALAARLADKIDAAGASGGSVRVGETGLKLTLRRKPGGAAPPAGEGTGHGGASGSGTVGGGTGRSGDAPPANGGRVAEPAGGPGAAPGGGGGGGGGQPAGDAAAGRVPADPEVIDRRIGRYSALFRSRGQHEAAGWLDKLREHVKSVGAGAALESLGPERGGGPGAQYEGGWDSMGDFARAYLGRHGVTLVGTSGETADGGKPLISSAAPKYGGSGSHPAAGSFLPRDPTLANKLEEAKKLPGLETSEDLGVVTGGKPVTHLTPDVTAKLDEKYGPGKWIVKAYGDDAAAGYGIFFPQRAAQVAQDARDTLWAAGEHLARYGFELRRDAGGTVVGLRHAGGEEYAFGTPHYGHAIYGDVRHWGDRAAAAAPHERGAELPGGGKEFMAQPAFPVVGVSEAERAAGKTIAPGEGRVHVVTRNGRAEVVPHATWIKGEHLPVVFESEETRAMAKAAEDAVNALPESERKGQIYAPDVVKTEAGYAVVEANPANHTGSSGYLGDNPFVIDAYVSHLTGRDPAHVRFVRRLLTARAG